jgi:hypothetical protein
LPRTPTGLGPLCSNRAFWDPIVASNAKTVKTYTDRANQQLTEQFPAWNDTAYLLFSQTGIRIPSQMMMINRREIVRNLAVAECFHMKRTYLDKLDDALIKIANQKTWVWAAHDRDLSVYNGKAKFVDLHSAELTAILTHILHMLGDVLKPETKALVLDQINKRSIEPYMNRMLGKEKLWFWQNGTTNWNPVCHAGMAYAVVSTVKDKTAVATAFLKIANYTKSYFVSFTNDGYGMEGMGYFNYGFNAYAELRETLFLTTKGNLDLFTDPKIAKITQFPETYPMSGGYGGAFGDSVQYNRFHDNCKQYVKWVFGDAKVGRAPGNGNLPGLILDLLMPSMAKRTPIPKSTTIERDPLRTWYPDAMVAVLRSGAIENITQSRMDVTFKIHGNMASHSHNDLGSVSVMADGDFVLGDVGGPKYYEARSLDARRLDSPLMNSYGHPVPLVNGKQQVDAIKVAPKDLRAKTSFTQKKDVVTADITAAYKKNGVRRLRSVKRSVTLDRTGAGSVTIADTIKMTKAGFLDFEGVFTVLGAWNQTSTTTGTVTGAFGKMAVVNFGASEPFKLKTEILNDYNITWTRVALQVADRKKRSATVTVVVSPLTF